MGQLACSSQETRWDSTHFLLSDTTELCKHLASCAGLVPAAGRKTRISV